ncbi:Por secretion system C-terminal sorting domain-containing protein [Tenacibaculum sp. MAR_2009_124]|uniref:CUB domain-containing protein n=1 Tax=Tenacibaculum sp. MAR_2009_124 TaxID=1250059 RepID=UPI000896F3DB|nr:CUB domain-containing protein [Tenacibaculum sp. MAR_2009_124]SEB35880.1 Por secretion system C-terminal sorting domain-containing protein [Tenacibaculum sp. MAR_2009_124]
MTTKLLWRWLMLSFLLLGIPLCYGQQIWQNTVTSISSSKVSDVPTNSISLKLDHQAFESKLALAQNRNAKSFVKSASLVFPTSNKDYEEFEIFESSNFSPALQAKYPSIKSYIGRSIYTNKTIRFSYSKVSGLQAFIQTKEGTQIVKPSNLLNNEYVFFDRKNSETFNSFECETIETTLKRTKESYSTSYSNNDGYLRKYRVAIATNSDYSEFFLTGNETSDQEKIEVVLAALNTSLTRINGIFERDFGITMELVDNNDQVIFIDTNSDPFSSGNYNSQLQNTLDSVIGNDNYDVGHLYVHTSSIYGNAGCIACVCETNQKGSAFTAHTTPDSDNFYMIACHEFGHQFGGYHVQSSSNCRSSAGRQEVEPGSGSSIMGYAGICPPNVQDHPDDYFNYVDIRDVIEWTRVNSSCAELISTGNSDPVVSAGDDYYIPVSTPFVLEGISSDVDAGNTLTYCWEQNNPEDPRSSNTPQPTWVYGPLFRSKLPADTVNRYIPSIQDVIQGNLTPTWEVLPSVGRTINFVLTVRDNAISGPKTASDEKIITVVDNGGAFTVTSQNSQENWTIGDTKTITWNVAGTDNAPINAQNVQISMSVDGGYTYPYILKNSTSNNGSADVIIPTLSESTTQARIRIKPVNNIFYAINSADISIQSTDFAMNFASLEQNVCKPNTVEFDFVYQTFLNFNETTVFSAEGLPQNVTATFSPTSATSNGTTVKLTITGTENLPVGDVNFIVKGSSTSLTRQTQLLLKSYEDQLAVPTLSTPLNNSFGVDVLPQFSWNEDLNVAEYTIQIAEDEQFNSIIETNNILYNNFTSGQVSSYNTTYYWRVKARNSCTESSYSDVYSFTTSCYAPSGILVTPSTNTADIQWTDTSGNTNWEIETVPSGTTPTGTGVNISTNPYTANNLESDNSYDLYLRSRCSATNVGNWVGPISFHTLADYCNGDKFYDPGLDENYPNNQHIETLIFPNNSDYVEVTFESFNLESGYDYLNIYDGNDTNATLIGRYSGATSPGTIRSKFRQGLTFLFISDGSITYEGWEASVNCITVTCPEPSDFSYDDLTSNSIKLTWNANGSESQWQVEYGEKGFTPGQGTKIIATTNPAQINNLTPNTEFDFYVTAICGAAPEEDDSFVVGPLAVKTPCGTFDAPYSNGAENQSPNALRPITNCIVGNPEVNGGSFYWTSRYSNNYQSTSSPYRAYEGNIYYRTIQNSGTNTPSSEAELTMPVVNISQLSNPVLNFHSFMLEEGLGSLHVDIYHNNQWILNVYEINGEQQYFSTDLWQEHLVDLSDYSNEIRVRFRAISSENSSYNEIDIDAIHIQEKPDCPSPTRLHYSNVTYNSVDLSWVSNQQSATYIIEYGDTNFTPGTGTSQTTQNTPFTLTGLPSDRELDIYIKTECSTSESENIGPINIKTLCAPVIAPFTYDVENQSYDVSDCWSSSYEGNYYRWLTLNTNNSNDDTGPFSARNGQKYFSAFSNSVNPNEQAILNTPLIDVSQISSPLLNFFTFMHGNNIGRLSIDVFANGNWDNDILVIDGAQQTSAMDIWKEYFVDLSNYSGIIQIRFKASPQENTYNSNEIAIDDINIVEKPTCIPPTNPTFDAITHSSTTINWTSNNNENQWVIEYGTIGFTTGTGTQVIVNSLPHELTNLNSNTDYDIYIKSTCNSNDESSWSGPYSFKTYADYCSGDLFYDTGGAIGPYSNNENYETTISPSPGTDFITVVFNSFQLESCCDYLSVYDGPDTNANLIGRYNGFNNPGRISSTHASGTLTFKFTSDGSVVGTGWEAQVLCEIEGCGVPYNLNTTAITTNSASVNWDATSTENKWIIEYGPQNFTPGSGTIIENSTPSVNLSELSSSTIYDVYVRTDCGNDSSSEASVITFQTLSDYCAGDRFYDSGGSDGNYSNNESITETIFPSEDHDYVSVTFNYFETVGCCDYLYIYDGPDTSATLIGTYSGSSSPNTITSTHESGALTFRFQSNGYTTGRGWDATVNCVRIACPSPNNLTVQNVNHNTANISWTLGRDETKWEITYGTVGFDANNPNITKILVENTSSHLLENLSPSTSYDLYVRAVCNTDGNSAWEGPISFRTLCGELNAPFYENFSSNNIPHCWTQSGSEAWNFNTNTAYDASSAGDFTPSGNTNYAWIDGSSPNGVGHKSYLRTLPIDISGLTSPSVQFSVFSVNNHDNSLNTLNVKVFDDTGSAQNLLDLQGQTQNGSWETFSFNLSDYPINSNTIQLEFSIEENGLNNPYYNDILIDEIKVDDSSTLSTHDPVYLSGVSIYPNPVKDDLTIKSEVPITKIQLYSTIGHLLFESDIKSIEPIYKVDFSEYPSGMYLLKVFSDDKQKSFKIIND